MKIHTLLTCLTLLLLTTGCSNKNETSETPQGLGKVLFDALQDDNKAAFDEHIYTDADRDNLLKSIKDDDKLTETLKTESQQILLTFFTVDRPELEASFAKIRQQALECGLQDWSKAEFVTSTFDQQDMQGLKFSDVKALFRWNGLEYELRTHRCLQTERGWVFLAEPTLNCRR